LSNGNLDLSSTTLAWKSVSSTIAIPTSGKWYFEVLQTVATSYLNVGVVPVGFTLSNHPGSTSTSWSWQSSAAKWNSSQTSWGSATTNGDIIMIAVDRDSGKIWAGANGTWFSSGNPASGTNEMFSGLGSDVLVPAIGVYDITSCVMNFGQRAFAYTAPSGFKALCDTNLPEPTIADGSTVMDVALYTGNGGTQSITGLNFSPDLVWIKRRNSTAWHFLFDTIRGTNKSLFSNDTLSEVNYGSGYLDAFTSDGFTLGSNADVNGTGGSLVAWTWDAGTSTDPSNTAGSITSQVRANVSAGFSIVTYPGNGTSGATVGHGLGVAPQLLIVKRRSSPGATANWAVWHGSLTAGQNLFLNTTDSASAYSPSRFTSTLPTSTVFSLGGGDETNYSGGTFVAYAFTPVVGYSSMGSYTGNGSTDGPFVYTGFRPRWIMVKSTGSAENWFLLDTARNTYNAVNSYLMPNSSSAEDANNSTVNTDFLSNGFKLRATTSALNTNAIIYIYAAFAENPFQYARAR
jgi:hypothetical protein